MDQLSIDRTYQLKMIGVFSRCKFKAVQKNITLTISYHQHLVRNKLNNSKKNNIDTTNKMLVVKINSNFNDLIELIHINYLL